MPPLYEYTCSQGHVSEYHRKVDDRHEPAKCETCPRPATLTPSVPFPAQVDGGTQAGLQDRPG